MAAVPKLLMGNHLMSRKHEEKWKREKEIFFKYTMHFFWMRNNLFFIILNIYIWGHKRTVRKRWTLKQTVKDLSLSCAPGKERPYL